MSSLPVSDFTVRPRDSTLEGHQQDQSEKEGHEKHVAPPSSHEEEEEEKQ